MKDNFRETLMNKQRIFSFVAKSVTLSNYILPNISFLKHTLLKTLNEFFSISSQGIMISVFPKMSNYPFKPDKTIQKMFNSSKLS